MPEWERLGFRGLGLSLGCKEHSQVLEFPLKTLKQHPKLIQLPTAFIGFIGAS